MADVNFETSDVRAGPPVDATLLFARPETVELPGFVKNLNDFARPLGERFEHVEDLGIETDGEVAVFQGDRHHVIVREVEAALPLETFEAAMANPLMAVLFPTAGIVARQHTEHVSVTVGGGRWDELPAEIVAEDLLPDAMLTKMRLARAAAGAYARNRYPIAVHWKQSDSFMAGPNFTQHLEKDAEEDETSLFVKAVPFSSSAPDAPIQTVGAITVGATNVIGCEVEVAEAPVTIAWAVEQALRFVSHSRDALPPAGTTVRSEDALLMVHPCEPSPGFPLGHIRLTVEKMPQGAVQVVESPTVAAPSMEPALTDIVEEQPRRVRVGFGRR